jgi:hypothetical protein
MLADLARHIALSYQQDEGLDPETSLQQISAAFSAELSSPTDEPSGSVVQ